MGMVRDPLVRRIIYGDGRRLPNQMADTNNGITQAFYQFLMKCN